MTPVLTLQDTIAAIMMWREARSDGQDGMRAVLHVAMNRVADPQRRWARDLLGVVVEHLQFSSMTAIGDKQTVVWPQRTYSADWVTFLQACDILQNPGTDPTGGCNHYHTVDVTPKWAVGHKPVVTIGKHKFYRL